MSGKRLLGRIAVSIAAVAVLAAIGAFLFRGPIERALIASVVRANLSKPSPFAEDGLYAGLCGTGSPMPDAHRAGPCIAVMAGTHLFIVDAGSGSARNVRLMGFPIGKAEALLLTHFHSDHISDLGEMELQRWAGAANAAPLDVIGPRGVESVVEGFNAAYRLDDGYRVAHHGAATMPPSGAGGAAKPFDLGPAADASAVVWDRDGVKITAFKVDHRPVEPAVGYRFEYRGRSLAVSGDTGYTTSLIEHAKGTDVLFCEALNAPMVQAITDNTPSATTRKITEDIHNYHATPEAAAKMAAAAGVSQLIYYHIIPPLPSPILKNIFLGDATKHYDKPITLGEDGMLVSLPAGTKTVMVKRLF